MKEIVFLAEGTMALIFMAGCSYWLCKARNKHNFFCSGQARGGGGVLPMWWVIHMCRGFDPLFSLWQDWARCFWGIFSHPPTPKRSFVVLKLPILTEFDLLGPKFHFSLDLFGSNFQRPAAHPHHFSDRVPPPGGQARHDKPLSKHSGPHHCWSTRVVDRGCRNLDSNS